MTPKSFRILVVDDESLYPELMRFHAEDLTPTATITLSHASSSDECLFKLNAATFDLIIMDIDLGRASLDGLSTIQKIRELSLTTPICIHSHFVDAIESRALEFGAQFALPKPMSKEDLLSLLSA